MYGVPKTIRGVVIKHRRLGAVGRGVTCTFEVTCFHRISLYCCYDG